MDNLTAILSAYSGVNVIIEGHTDNTDDPQNKILLSMDSAKTIRNILLEKGVDQLRIRAAGYGRSRPTVPNNSEARKDQNKRI